MTFVVFLLLWVIDWLGSFAGPTVEQDPDLPVDHAALRRLRQGRHRHEARRVLPELHHVRPVPDRQVGRQRTVARIDVQEGCWDHRLAGHGPGLRGRRRPLPETGVGSCRAVWPPAGLVCCCCTRSASGATSPRRSRARQTRLGTMTAASILVVLGILVLINYHRHPREQALGPDGASGQFTLSDQTQEGAEEAR